MPERDPRHHADGQHADTADCKRMNRELRRYQSRLAAAFNKKPTTIQP